jgi:hypothetical protein
MPPMPLDQVPPYGPARRLIPSRAVAERYSVHLRSIARWMARGVIPPPDQVINGRHYWFLETLEEADRQRTIEAAAKGRPVKSTPAISSEKQELLAP